MITPTVENQAKLSELGSSELRTGMNLYDLLRRTELTYELLQSKFEMPDVPPAVKEQIEIVVKYEGYIKKQIDQVERAQKLETKLLPDEIDYMQIQGLSLEARQKLTKIKPRSIGQAGRISGVSPADVSILMIFLEQHRRKENS